MVSIKLDLTIDFCLFYDIKNNIKVIWIVGLTLAPKVHFLDTKNGYIGSLQADDTTTVGDHYAHVGDIGFKQLMLNGKRLDGPEIISFPNEDYTIEVVSLSQEKRNMEHLNQDLMLVWVLSDYENYAIAVSIQMGSAQFKKYKNSLQHCLVPRCDTQWFTDRNTHTVWFFTAECIAEFSVNSATDDNYLTDEYLGRRLNDFMIKQSGYVSLNVGMIKTILDSYKPLYEGDTRQLTFVRTYRNLDALRASLAEQNPILDKHSYYLP